MRRVLVVDDETAITDGLLALFELDRVDARGAYDRVSAETMIAEDFFPVILADLRLETEAEGLELLRSIRKTSPRSRVISLTGFATPEIENQLLNLGSSRVLRKPMSFDEIIAIVEEMLTIIEQEAVEQQARTSHPLDLAGLYTDVRKVLFSIPQRRYGLTSEETEELVQEAWCLFLQKQGTIQNAKPWLAGTIVNLCKQQIQLNSKNRERTCSLDPDLETAGVADRADESQAMIHQALGRVDQRTRKLCILIGMEGWSYEEVSAEMKLPIGSVGPLYIRAKKKMKKMLAMSN